MLAELYRKMDVALANGDELGAAQIYCEIEYLETIMEAVA